MMFYVFTSTNKVDVFALICLSVCCRLLDIVCMNVQKVFGMIVQNS